MFTTLISITPSSDDVPLRFCDTETDCLVMGISVFKKIIKWSLSEFIGV